MANKRISMRKIREIIRLKVELKLSTRKIALALKTSKNTVKKYLKSFEKSGLKYREMKDLSDSQLIEVLKNQYSNVSPPATGKYNQLAGYFEYFTVELKKTGVTLQILWEEYRQKYKDGYSYPQFCFHFRSWKKTANLYMPLEHKAGDKMFVDYAGKQLKIVDRNTGKETKVQTFVAILPSSQLTYVEASLSQKKESWIASNENALWYFGGVPNAIVPDNLKSGVTKANRYEPDINPEYYDFAKHYNLTILPTRPSKPKDKALVESAVKIIYSKIYAKLRNRTFYSLPELNKAIWIELEAYNNMKFQKIKMSRKEIFLETEKEHLNPLPTDLYEIKKFLKLNVQFNYHIEIREDHQYYSVPWQYKGKKVIVIYTESYVDIYHDNKRIAFHKRCKDLNQKYITNKDHMPSHHRFYSDWSAEKFTNWAKGIGENVKKVIEKILASKRHPEQGFKICMGILNLSRTFGNERLENACKMANDFGFYSYKKINNILQKKLDLPKVETTLFHELPTHLNIRGKEYYN